MKSVVMTISGLVLAVAMARGAVQKSGAPLSGAPSGAVEQPGRVRSSPLLHGPLSGLVAAETHEGEPQEISPEALTAVVKRLCGACHNDQLMFGNLSLTDFDVAAAAERAGVAEKMISKLRAGMMPPPGIPRPGGDTMQALVETLETLVDEAAASSPNPGNRTFQRLNRAEYERSIEELLGLTIQAGDFLPLDTKSENFDNIADVQMLSPTLLEAYLNAASQISRLALGDANARPSERTYTVSGYRSQMERVEGAPFGTRGGLVIEHIFPADGEYVFLVTFESTTTGIAFFGAIARYEQIEISINGEPVALLDIDQWLSVEGPEGIMMRTEPVFVRAGPQRVAAAFVRRQEGPLEDLVSPHEWSLADRDIGLNGYGITSLPHLRDLIIGGPYEVTGVSPTPTRERIFTCTPKKDAEARPCAESIVRRLATAAYRRPVEPRDVEGLMDFYEEGAADGGFEIGVRTALQAILASPHFVFRYEPAAGNARPGEIYRISDVALASRLSFFLWGTPPDDELMALARAGKLDERALERQVKRMLDDPRAEALGTRFAAQWLRLQDLDKVHPDAFWFPDFDQQLADAMRRETELFFYNLVKEDRSMLELFSADYTFVNERLARHYGMVGVAGNEFRRVAYADDRRRGLFGHGSILVLTSHANRTSPVLRGKWVMEVLLGTPPPPPPPGVPDLEETEGAKDGRFLTTRERMEMHRANPVCRSCHQFMDPIGLALDNFDVTGKWRIRENGMDLDTEGTFYDGTTIASPNELIAVLLNRPTPLIRTFTENLMAYALGRRVEYFDKPTVRAIADEAAKNDYRISSFVLGVVKSDAFQMKREAVAEQSSQPSGMRY
jgi:hypothetical protein